MKLHQRGLELLLNLQDAIEQQDKLTPAEVSSLLREMEAVLRDLLARDNPVENAS